jgi:hypothetical protein
MVKILFLDVDGVLNCSSTRQRYKGFIGIDPKLATIVQRIIGETECQVVLSSVWRLEEDSRSAVRKQVCNFMDITKNLGFVQRGNEVAEWLERAGDDIERYAILDDNSDFFPEQPLFQTKWYNGLTDEIADRVIAHLNNKEVGNG